jgi:hypothetical protein
MTAQPITLDMVKSGALKKGDDVIANITYTDAKLKKTVVREGMSYKVDEIYPPGNPDGFVLKSDVGRWYFKFIEPYGGGKYFSKVISTEGFTNISDNFTPTTQSIPTTTTTTTTTIDDTVDSNDITDTTEEEELGEMGTVPWDILKLVSNKAGIKRNEIINFLVYKSSASSPSARTAIKNQVLEAIRFLDRRGYIKLLPNSLDKYDIELKGLQLLGLDKQKYKMPTGE